MRLLFALFAAIALLTSPALAKDKKTPRHKDGMQYGAIFNGKQNWPTVLIGVAADWAGECAGGKADVCYKLGEAFETGLGDLDMDAPAALGYYIKACDNGLEAGCGKTVEWLLMGHGGFEDAKLAVEKGRPACFDNNMPEACTWIGYAKYNGLGGYKVDQPAAGKLWSWACDKGSEAGCRMHGNYAFEIAKTQEEQLVALGRFSDGCFDRDQSWACLGLARFVEKNPYKMFDAEEQAEIPALLSGACFENKGDTLPACAEWGKRAYLSGQDVQLAEQVLASVCDEGFGDGCSVLGRMALANQYPGSKVTPQQAIYYLRRSCDFGDGRGCMGLGTAYTNAMAVQEDKEAGKALTAKGCDLGFDLACQLVTKETRAELAKMQGWRIDPSLSSDVQIAQIMQQKKDGQMPDAQAMAMLASEGIPDANWVLGQWALGGLSWQGKEIMPQNTQLALTLISKAGQAGHVEAAKWMGYSQWYGLSGLAENRESAKGYMEIAAGKGDTEALQYLRSMVNTEYRERMAMLAAQAAAEAEARRGNFWTRWFEAISASARSARPVASSGPSLSEKLAAESWQRTKSAMDKTHWNYRVQYMTGATSVCPTSNPYC